MAKMGISTYSHIAAPDSTPWDCRAAFSSTLSLDGDHIEGVGLDETRRGRRCAGIARPSGGSQVLQSSLEVGGEYALACAAKTSLDVDTVADRQHAGAETRSPRRAFARTIKRADTRLLQSRLLLGKEGRGRRTQSGGRLSEVDSAKDM